MEKLLINNWNIEKKKIIKYQKVFVNNKNNNINVHINQYIGTPGIIINRLFNIKVCKHYILEVSGFAKECTQAFLWAEDVNGNQLIPEYTFLNNELSTVNVEFKFCINTLIRIGILVNNPMVYNTFSINEINLYECDEEPTYNEGVLCSNLNTESTDTNTDTDTHTSSTITENYCNQNIIYNNVVAQTPVPKNLDLFYTLFNSSYKYLTENIKYSNVIPYHKPSTLLLDIRPCIFNDSQLIDFIKMSTSNYFKVNACIPLGYMFFSQLITNDITHLSACQCVLPIFNLSSIYEDKYENSIFDTDRLFIIDNTALPDFRNSSNFILNKIHIIFQLLHNKLMSVNSTVNLTQRFNIVKQEVIYTYQYIIVYDYLRTIIDKDIYKCVIKEKPQYYSVHDINGHLPLEFVMLLKLFNNLLLPDNIRLTKTTNISELDLYIYNNESVLSTTNQIDWSLFFQTSEYNCPQYSKRINCNILEDLNYTCNIKNDQIEDNIDTDYMSIMLKDLLFSQCNKLPSGQHIANRFKLNPIDSELMKTYDSKEALRTNFMLDNTPFLMYVLKESEIFKGGRTLTGIGGIIIAEVIMTLLLEDTNSFMNSNENWTPSIPSMIEGQLEMRDIINFIYN